jgi:hypothetical protein
MTQRFRVIAMQRLLAVTASRRFAVVDGVGVIDEGALCLVVSVLTARFVTGRRFGRGALTFAHLRFWRKKLDSRRKGGKVKCNFSVIVFEIRN